jgi:monovalent cation:H+ antiporter-2, CPA2 family
MTATCGHIEQLQPLAPRTVEGCDECLALGDTWVKLRMCMICGQVGCCDSSKNTHATKHFHASGHPVVQSAQPGESWSYCYVDDLTVPGTESRESATT